MSNTQTKTIVEFNPQCTGEELLAAAKDPTTQALAIATANTRAANGSKSKYPYKVLGVSKRAYHEANGDIIEAKRLDEAYAAAKAKAKAEAEAEAEDTTPEEFSEIEHVEEIVLGEDEGGAPVGAAAVEAVDEDEDEDDDDDDEDEDDDEGDPFDLSATEAAILSELKDLGLTETEFHEAAQAAGVPTSGNQLGRERLAAAAAAGGPTDEQLAEAAAKAAQQLKS